MQTRAEILEDVIKILRESLGQEVEISPKTHLETDLAVDSLRAMEILAAVEDHFDITIPININYVILHCPLSRAYTPIQCE